MQVNTNLTVLESSSRAASPGVWILTVGCTEAVAVLRSWLRTGLLVTRESNEGRIGALIQGMDIVGGGEKEEGHSRFLDICLRKFSSEIQ